MLNFAALTPHPPIIIPGIGQETELVQVKSTIEALQKLGSGLKKIKPETIIIISPHAQTNYNSFLINIAPKLNGDFENFRLTANSISLEFDNDLALAQKIKEAADIHRINCAFYQGKLDHGSLVPLYYLSHKLTSAKEPSKPRLVQLSFSLLDRDTHFKYGKLIGKIIGNEKSKIAVIASGDFSHRLTPEAPAGYSPLGKAFDEKLIALLNKKDMRGILEMDPTLIEQAGECGLRSLIILLGILNGRKYRFQTLSYEGPFGVGYLTGKAALKGKQ